MDELQAELDKVTKERVEAESELKDLVGDQGLKMKELDKEKKELILKHRE